MKIFYLSFLTFFCLSLLAPDARADALSAPDKEVRREDMSSDEYKIYRDKMRKRMEEQKQTEEQQQRPAEQSDKVNSAYGKGFDSRNPAEDSEEIRDKMAKLSPEEREIFRAELKAEWDKLTPEEIMKIRVDRLSGRSDFLQQRLERFQMRLERRRVIERPVRPLRPGR